MFTLSTLLPNLGFSICKVCVWSEQLVYLACIHLLPSPHPKRWSNSRFQRSPQKLSRFSWRCVPQCPWAPSADWNGDTKVKTTGFFLFEPSWHRVLWTLPNPTPGRVFYLGQWLFLKIRKVCEVTDSWDFTFKAAQVNQWNYSGWQG